ncbi:MAG: tetratricopeptide repeat protein [Bacteroidales bacterium]|nr:tetratricopeptide repeat protein [Bacteroidales bacterium]
MNKSQIVNLHENAINQILNKKIYDAIVSVKNLAKEASISVNNDGIIMAEETYKLMLKYSVQGMNDPNRESILCQLQISLLMMADSYKNKYFKNNTSSLFFAGNHCQPIDLPNNNNLNDWFNFIVSNENSSEDLINLLESLIENKKCSWYCKSLIVSALTISLLLYFDIKKVKLLYSFYKNNQEQVWQRALVGLFIIYYIYNNRITLYKEALEILENLKTDSKFTERYETIILQFIRSIDTDKITKKINEEILPEVSKIAPGIKEKMKSDSLNNDDKGIEEKNPDWSNYLSDSPGLIDKLSEISKLQLEGGDVFLNSFAMLKSFPFFNTLSNWFIPFYHQNKDIANLSVNGGDKFQISKFASGLERAPFICNSDKYSFCLSLSSMPPDQINTMGKYFFAEVDEMNEISYEEILLRKPEFSYKAVTQYIQDIYRFFKLNSAGKDLPDIFEKEFYPAGTLMFDSAFTNVDEMRKVGEFFFTNEHYQQAFGIFKKISEENPNFEIFQKIGYSAQKFNDIELALKYYLNAQFFDDSQLWNLKKIGWCYRKLKNPAKALEYYKKAETLDTENLSIATAIGRCQLELENYEEALKYYFKVEYLDSKNSKVWRPISWCCYVLGKYSQAEKYVNKLISANPEAEDYVLAGNIFRIQNKMTDAIDFYIKAFSFSDFNITKLEDSLNTDYKSENVENITQENNLILDYIKYQLNN